MEPIVPEKGRKHEGTTLKWEAAYATRIGGRKEQQDRLGAFSSEDGLRWLLVVADGMGGHQGGSLASQTLIEIAERSWKDCNGQPANPKQFLEDLCQEANQEIHEKGIQQELDPHTTVIAVLIRESQAFWVHVGDSRLYRFRDRTLLERTKDHSLLQILVDEGEVDEEEMGTHPDQNKLLRAIGEETPTKTTHGFADLEPEDRMLLCSDGFWERISVDEMAQLLASDNLQTAVNRQAEIASERGGPRGDNIAVVVARALASPTATTSKRRRVSWKAGIYSALATLVIVSILGTVGWWMSSNEKTIDRPWPFTPTADITEPGVSETERAKDSRTESDENEESPPLENDPGMGHTNVDPSANPPDASSPEEP